MRAAGDGSRVQVPGLTRAMVKLMVKQEGLRVVPATHVHANRAGVCPYCRIIGLDRQWVVREKVKLYEEAARVGDSVALVKKGLY